MYKFTSALLLGALSLAANATPVIYIGNVYDYLDGPQSSYRKRITNTGEMTAFVRVDLSQIIYDEGEPREVPVRPQTANVQPPALIATPVRLIIPAKGTQATRLMVTGARDRERYYRVRFVPVIPDKDDAFALSDAERQAYQASFKAGVNVLTGYGTVFIVRPAVPHFDTRIIDTPQHYSLTNAGNSTLVLEALKDCTAGEEPVCEPGRIRHVMPGRSYSFEKKPGRVVHFNRIEGDATYPTQV